MFKGVEDTQRISDRRETDTSKTLISADEVKIGDFVQDKIGLFPSPEGSTEKLIVLVNGTETLPDGTIEITMELRGKSRNHVFDVQDMLTVVSP